MTFELTDQGITVQTVDEILTELETAARAPDGIHPLLDCTSTSVFGQAFGIWAEREALLQQAIRDVLNSFTPKSTGQALTNVSLLTGTQRNPATFSTVTATLTIAAGATIPAGSRANVNGDSNAVFALDTDTTNSTGVSADFSVQMTALTAGPIRAAAGSLTVINTPVAGWTAVTNPFDALVGSDVEADPALRLRREQELRVQGSTEVDAVVADVEEVANVLQARGFNNPGPTANSDGVAAHSFEIVVWDGVTPLANNNDIAQAIFTGGPAGIQSVQSGLGTAASGTALDKEKASHTVLFTRALQRNVYIAYTLTVDSTYPVDGDTQVKAAVAAALTAILTIGGAVVATKLFAPAYSVTGVIDVVSATLGFSASPTGTSNLVIGSREIAIIDTSRITVSS